MAAIDFTERIVSVPEIRSGKPTLKGTRMAVRDVLEYLAGGMSYEEVLEDFPYITKEDILACIAFAAERERHTMMVVA